MSATAPKSQAHHQDPSINVALLTGGGDRPYAYGLATELIARGVGMDLIGSDDLDSPEFHGKQGVKFLNLRGDQLPEASLAKKITRVSVVLSPVDSICGHREAGDLPYSLEQQISIL